jgi:hypothetical protein
MRKWVQEKLCDKAKEYSCFKDDLDREKRKWSDPCPTKDVAVELEELIHELDKYANQTDPHKKLPMGWSESIIAKYKSLQNKQVVHWLQLQIEHIREIWTSLKNFERWLNNKSMTKTPEMLNHWTRLVKDKEDVLAKVRLDRQKTLQALNKRVMEICERGRDKAKAKTAPVVPMPIPMRVEQPFAGNKRPRPDPKPTREEMYLEEQKQRRAKLQELSESKEVKEERKQIREELAKELELRREREEEADRIRKQMDEDKKAAQLQLELDEEAARTEEKFIEKVFFELMSEFCVNIRLELDKLYAPHPLDVPAVPAVTRNEDGDAVWDFDEKTVQEIGKRLVKQGEYFKAWETYLASVEHHYLKQDWKYGAYGDVGRDLFPDEF